MDLQLAQQQQLLSTLIPQLTANILEVLLNGMANGTIVMPPPAPDLLQRIQKTYEEKYPEYAKTIQFAHDEYLDPKPETLLPLPEPVKSNIIPFEDPTIPSLKSLQKIIDNLSSMSPEVSSLQGNLIDETLMAELTASSQRIFPPYEELKYYFFEPDHKFTRLDELADPPLFSLNEALERIDNIAKIFEDQTIYNIEHFGETDIQYRTIFMSKDESGNFMIDVPRIKRYIEYIELVKSMPEGPNIDWVSVGRKLIYFFITI